MSDEERAERGARDRRKRGHVTMAAVKAWSTRAERFEKLGQTLVEAASKAKRVPTRANGPRMDPRFRAGMELLDAADKLWARVHRVRGSTNTPPTRAAANGHGGDALDTFLGRKPRD